MEKCVKKCDCGLVHEIKTEKILIKNNCFDLFVNEIVLLKNKKTLILASAESCRFANMLCDELFKKGKSFNVINFNNIEQTKVFACNIKNYKQDVVVAMGNEQLISVAKYYSYINECELIIFPVGEFLDFTFSKFARISDGCFYDFYDTVEPKQIFIDTKLNVYNALLNSYISSKYIAIFDNVVRECVYKRNGCERCKLFLKTELKKLYELQKKSQKTTKEKSFWFLVRLGLAMTFFNETYSFFGGDKAVVDLLQAYNKETSFLNAEYISLKIIINAYKGFYKICAIKGVTNINKHLKNLERLLNVSSTKVLTRFVSSDYFHGNNSVNARYNNYYPYLKMVLQKCLKKIDLTQKENYRGFEISMKQISKEKLRCVFASAPCVYPYVNLLHVILSYGYLDFIL